MSIKQLNEKQLSEWFKASRIDSDVSFEDLNSMSEASELRIEAAEKIADNNLLSATHQTLNGLNQWTSSLSDTLTKSNSSTGNLFDKLLERYLKPALAFSFVSGFALVLMMDNNKNPQTTSFVNDAIMFSSSFDGQKQIQKDSITVIKFEDEKKSDKISSSDFG